MGLSVRVDGLMVMAALGVGVGVYAYTQKGKIQAALNTVNPVSDQNAIYTSAPVQAVIGHEFDDGYTVADKYFAYIDKINPFNGSDDYANRVWGLE